MKITGWEKLNGISYKGYCIVNPIHNQIGTQYIADIMDIANQKRTNMQLRLDTESGFEKKEYTLTIKDKLHNVVIKHILNIEMLKRISNFRMVFELCIEEYIKEVEKTWTSQYGTSNIVQAQTAQLPKSSSVLPSFDDFVNIRRGTPARQLTQTLINK